MSTNPTRLLRRAGTPIADAYELPDQGMRLNSARRYLMNHLVTVLAVLSTVAVVVPLVAIFAYLL